MMKYNTILAIAAAGLMTNGTLATETTQRGEILEGINMFTPEDGDPAYKVKANEEFGTQWAVDVAYGYWHTNGAAANNHNNYMLLHAQLNQRIIEDNHNGGTWLRFEVSGSWGLDKRSAASDKQFVDGVGEFTGMHADIYGPHDFVIPELALMHYFNGKRACIIAGMVNMTNYFDAVGPANDSFSGFTNGGFVNSTVLALPDANLGAIAQFEINDKSYAMLGVSRETTAYGYNPFNDGSSYMVVGEYGRTILDGAAIVRINPFFRQVEEADKNRKNAGVAASIEYAPCDELTLFARSGFGAKQDLGASFDFSCGATFQGIPGREDDFVGLAFGVFKGTNTADEPANNNREYVLEAMYSLQINDYWKLVPHIQYIKDPAYSGESDAVIMGVQAVFSF
ncbi:MAG: carbohydrate porin [Akkermansia sp.]|nr:carbohydrate porin [Akkermansia sp.]